MENTNQKIIQAVIDKTNQVCPDSLAMIGIYGSVATEDTHEKSDLDLLILIEDDDGRKLGAGFILEDRNVGYDIYCTDWAGLKYDAQCHHAHLSKLLDSQIVYVKNQAAYDELCALRARAKAFLTSQARFQRVHECLEQAKVCYANACLLDDLGAVRLEACGVVSYLLDAVMLYHGTYFRRGVKRTFEELAELPLDSVFVQTLQKLPLVKNVCELRRNMKQLMLYAQNHLENHKSPTEPTEALAGTYEEMYSNWRNKVEEAARNQDAFSSFMNMGSFAYMLHGIAEETDIGVFDVMNEYNPESLEDNIQVFDANLEKYEQVYRRAGIRVKRFGNVDEFVKDYHS